MHDQADVGTSAQLRKAAHKEIRRDWRVQKQLQGENDIRVPRGQAEELARLLEDRGTLVETVFYADEGHGFLKAENNLDAIRRIVEWFEEHLAP